MEAGISQEQRRTIDLALTNNPALAKLVLAMVEAAETLNLSSKSDSALSSTSAALPEVPTTAAVVSIEEMKAALREADCLYDNAEIWKQLGAKEVPEIPEAVIQEAYQKGGRVILQCSSISEKTDALRAARLFVEFSSNARPSDYVAAVSQAQWVVVQSHVDRNTLGQQKREVVTNDNPAPTAENSFAVRAYARLDGGRQPRGCENVHEFTSESEAIGSFPNSICVNGCVSDESFAANAGAARFGPPRN